MTDTLTNELTGAALSDLEYRALEGFRYELRRFLAFADGNARAEGLTTQQHQALLAIRAYAGEASVGTVAERLLIESHSASELVKRLAARGLVTTEKSTDDRRRLVLQLTPDAEQRLARLSSMHRAEVERMQPTLGRLLNGIVRRGRDGG